MLTFRLRTFLGLIAFGMFLIVWVSVGIRWHCHRAEAAVYARQEVEHVFEAGNFARAARNSARIDDATARVAQYRKLAEMHTRAAEECARLKDFYEKSW